MATIDPNNPIRIPTGTSSNDGTGLPLRDAFININNEFDALDTDVIALNAHALDTSNPHGVTAAQVGVNNPTVTITGSGALGGTGSFTLNQANNSSITISHDSKSVSSSPLSSPTNVITGLSFDSYGHVNSYQYTPAADLGGGGGGGGSDSYATILSSATLSNDVYFDSIDLSSQSTIDIFDAVTSNAYSPSFDKSSFYGNGGLSFLYYSMQNSSNGFSVSGSKNFLFSVLESSNDPRFNRPPSFYGLIDNANGNAEFNQNLVFATDGNGINGVNWSNASSKQIANNISIGSSNFYFFNYDSQFLRENVVVGKNNFDFASYYPVNGNVENNILIGTSNLTAFSCGRENGFTKLICIGNQNLQFGSDFSAFSSNFSAIVLGNGNQSMNLDNIVIIGNSTAVNGDNEFQLGNSLNTVYTHQAIQTRSDERDKTEIQDTVFGLDFVNRLRPVDFKWDFRSDYYYNEEYDEDVLDEDGNVVKTITKQRIVKPDRDGSKKRNRFHCGLIAQEVKSTLDELGLDFGVLHDASVGGGEDVLTLGYTELVGPLIKAIQELTARVQQLETA